MALTVEDGTIVAGADTWTTLAEFQAYAATFGWTLTKTDAEQEIDLRKAQRAISTRYNLAGRPVSVSQTTCLPRYWGRTINGFAIDAYDIPQAFKDAQAELAWAIHEGADPFVDVTAGTVSKGPVTSESYKAGPVETSTSYSTSTSGASYDATSMANYTAVKALLAPYLGASAGQVRLQRG